MKNTAHPLTSTDLATLSKFFKILEKQGVTREHIDMVIRSPDLAKAIAKALGIIDKHVPTSFDTGAQHHFLLHTLMGVESEEHLSEVWRGLLDHYMIGIHFADLLSTRPQRDIDMLIDGYGLTGGPRLGNIEIGDKHYISRSRVGQILQKAEGALRRIINEEGHRQMMQAIPGDVRIEDADFSIRTTNCLQRAGIRTMRQLAEKRESELMNITNFGWNQLEEVKAKLDEYGLSLKP